MNKVKAIAVHNEYGFYLAFDEFFHFGWEHKTARGREGILLAVFNLHDHKQHSFYR